MRVYTLPFNVISQVTGPADLAGFQVASGKYAELLGVEIDDVDTVLPSGFMLALQIQCYFNGTLTKGAGFTAITPVPDGDIGDKPAQSTGWVGPCTGLSSIAGAGSGSEIPLAWGCHIYQGNKREFTEGKYPALGGEAWVFQLNNLPPATIKLSGLLRFGERGRDVVAT